MSHPSTPPPLPGGGSSSPKPFLTVVLSLILVLFLGSAVVSFLGDSLFLLFQRQELAAIAALGSLLMLMAGFLACGLMAWFPGIPKRVFLPVALFIPVVGVAVLPLLVYYFEHIALIAWFVSLGQLLLAAFVIRRLQGDWKFRWPLLPESSLADRRFSWGNLAAVTLSGLLLLLPGLVLYTAYSGKLAMEHFTDGFVIVRPAGISMQVRNYVRDDGKKIMLVPMSHVGEPEFYQSLSASFPADSVILMEGVSDRQKLTTTHSDYSKMATALGGVEQTQVFKPQGELVAADVDMSSFSPATLGMLKTAMLLHAKGVTPETLPILMKPTPPGLEKQLMDDILTKRNLHLLGVIRERLPTSQQIIVPWGAAHMPEIAREIQKLGFRPVDTREFLAIRFGS
ncbi:MAG: hypothetical protein V4689_20855 [Verrucomicrobiota bacterium]